MPQFGSHEWLMKSAGSGSGVPARYSASSIWMLRICWLVGQQVELVAGHAPTAERGDDLAGRDRFDGDAAVTPCPGLRSDAVLE